MRKTNASPTAAQDSGTTVVAKQATPRPTNPRRERPLRLRPHAPLDRHKEDNCLRRPGERLPEGLKDPPRPHRRVCRQPLSNRKLLISGSARNAAPEACCCLRHNVLSFGALRTMEVDTFNAAPVRWWNLFNRLRFCTGTGRHWLTMTTRTC